MGTYHCRGYTLYGGTHCMGVHTIWVHITVESTHCRGYTLYVGTHCRGYTL